MRVPAIVYHQAGATIERHTALIIINRPGDDKSSWYASWAGILYARAGAVVLTYDPVGEYERNKNRLSHTVQYSWSGGIGKRLAGLMVTDVLQAANYLSHRSDVDPKRIAVFGSMGSFAASLACAAGAQIHACVLPSGGDLNAPKFLDDLLKQAAAELGSSKNVLNYSGNVPYFLTKPAALWLEKKLKFRNWTRKQINAMPETHKAGATVLGANIPAVPRDELYAVPKVVWQFQKNNYTYESWLARAKTAIAQGKGATGNAH
jgi:dienelactone hydrolase